MHSQLSLLISFGILSHYVTLFLSFVSFYFLFFYFSPLFCFLKTTLSFCYTLSLSQVQVHNASQTRRATLDRQVTRKEEMGLANVVQVIPSVCCRWLATGVDGECSVPGCRRRAWWWYDVAEACCKTEDTYTKHKRQRKLAKTKNEVWENFQAGSTASGGR